MTHECGCKENKEGSGCCQDKDESKMKHQADMEARFEEINNKLDQILEKIA